MSYHPTFRDLAWYVAFALITTSFFYYVPDYFFLEQLTAWLSSFALRILGVQVWAEVRVHGAYVDGIQIVRDCTGIQVIAVFLGLLLPLQRANWRRKIKALVILSIMVIAANVLRIALEIWLVYRGILPWYLAHYPLSLILGIVGVFILVEVTDRVLPEFGDAVASFYSVLTHALEGWMVKPERES